MAYGTLQLVQQQDWGDITVPVNSDLSTKQFYFVKLDSNGYLVSCGAGDLALGVLQDAPDGTKVTIGTVRIAGVSMVQTSAGFTTQSFAKSDTNGLATPVTTNKDQYNGRVLGTVTSGDLAAMVLTAGSISL